MADVIGAFRCPQDAATLFQQLPKEENGFYLVNAVAAWELVASEPMTSEMLQRMIETLFSGNDTEEALNPQDSTHESGDSLTQPISGTQSGGI